MDISSPSSVRRIHCAGQTLETTVTDKASVVERWILLINTIYQTASYPVVVGLDSEWWPNLPLTDNRTATLQLCIGLRCLIIQLLHLDYMPVLLEDFLMSTKFIFVGKNIEVDVRKLRVHHDLYCKNYSDLLDIAEERYPGRYLSKGLEKLALEVVELRMPSKMKSVQLSNWAERALSAEQIEYACVDAYASYCVGYKLLVNKDFSCAEARKQSGCFGFVFLLVRVFVYLVGFALVVSFLDYLGLGLVGKIE